MSDDQPAFEGESSLTVDGDAREQTDMDSWQEGDGWEQDEEEEDEPRQIEAPVNTLVNTPGAPTLPVALPEVHGMLTFCPLPRTPPPPGSPVPGSPPPGTVPYLTPFLPAQAPSVPSQYPPQVAGSPLTPGGASTTAVVVVNGPGRPRLWDAGTFMVEAGSTRQSFLWEGLLPETGVVMIAGAPFSAKTVVMTLLAAAARDGSQLAGRAVLDANVLYVKLEHQDSDFVELLARARLGFGIPALDNLHIIKELMLDDAASVAYLKACADHVEAHVIIIDSLRRASRMDENSSQEAAEIMRRLHDLSSDGQRLVIVLHHLAKGAVASPRGSGDFLAGVDTFISMTKSGDVVTLSARHHAGGEEELRLKLDFSDGSYSGTGPAERPRVTRVRDPSRAASALLGPGIDAAGPLIAPALDALAVLACR